MLTVLKQIPERVIHMMDFTKGINFTLRSKFILSFFVLILLPFIAFGTITYKTAEKIIQDNVSFITLKNVAKISSKIDYYVEDLQSIYNLISANRELVRYFGSLQEIDPSGDSHLAYQQLADSNSSYKIVSNIVSLKNEKFSGIYFLDSKNVYFIHPLYSYYISNNIYKDEKWYEKARKIENSIWLFSDNWQPTGKSNPEPIISIAQNLVDPRTAQIFGILRFDLDFTEFSQLINSEDSDNYVNSNLFITDSENHILYSKKSHNFGSYLNFPGMETDMQVFNTTLEGKKMFVVVQKSSYTSCKTVSIIQADEVLKDLIYIKSVVIIMTIACILIVLFLSSAMSSILLEPLNKLRKAMAQVEKGDFTTRVFLKNRDETKFLADSFNNMTSNIETLITKVYTAELKLRDAELKALQSQINPHFLYNTLESIRGAALSQGMRSIAAMTKSLSLLFRYSINGRLLVPLKDELKHLENYMAIQNFRHDNKFELLMDVPEELYGYIIPKLSLQPIVENSIKHGLEMELGKGRLEIKISKSNDIIKAVIRDNGKGISQDKLEELNLMLENTIPETASTSASPYSTPSIGLSNVNSRLKLHFGKQYGLKVLQAEKGTIVEMTFPAVAKEDEADENYSGR